MEVECIEKMSFHLPYKTSLWSSPLLCDVSLYGVAPPAAGTAAGPADTTVVSATWPDPVTSVVLDSLFDELYRDGWAVCEDCSPGCVKARSHNIRITSHLVIQRRVVFSDPLNGIV